ncbi:MAG TPA: sugar transferase [Saprospirales bacterium]|nr:sugar transferase [Saprospirales bacterium]HAY71148.1 sugar transferase [Saprospirales bacterium]HRQ30859.1 sugar transferase [Saprospiraceae bacterium]
MIPRFPKSKSRSSPLPEYMVIDSRDGLEELVRQEVGEEAMNFVLSQIGSLSSDAFVGSTSTRFNILRLPDNHYKHIVNLKQINDFRFLNKFFESVNKKLPDGGLFIDFVETYATRRNRKLKKYWPPFNWLVYLIDLVFYRIMPKLPFTRGIYFFITRGKRRILSKAETFGRLYSCGFEVVDEKVIQDLLFFCARKIKEPAYDMNPTYGPIARLRRVGKDGKMFNVYKLRTMHPYSEYLQDYVYQKHKLAEGGKFKNDFRISWEGAFFRKFWLDELPMLINLIKGDMKLVGVRPLSRQYFSMYSKELQEKRTKSKPGLLPPFYADMPKTLEEIMDSEARYLDAYEKAPFRTDIKYFFKIFYNILVKGKRSK